MNMQRSRRALTMSLTRLPEKDFQTAQCSANQVKPDEGEHDTMQLAVEQLQG